MVKKKETKKESTKDKRDVKKDEKIAITINKNVLIVAVGVIALIIGFVIGNYFSLFAGSGKVSEEEVGKIVKSTVENLLSQQYGGSYTPEVNVVDVVDQGSYYEVSFDVQGQEMSVYVSYDGKKIFLQGLDTVYEEGVTTASGDVERYDVSVDDDPYKGSENASVVIIEFSDFQCPFCKRFFDTTLKQLEEEYIKTGKVKFVYRDFPLDFHQNALLAAMAAECADDQGRFWDYHDMLFERQSEWEGLNNEEAKEKFKEYASQLGLDENQFNECLDSEKYREEVMNDMKDGQKYGVTGTPTLFINGIKLVGAQPYNVVKSIIEEELAKAGN